MRREVDIKEISENVIKNVSDICIETTPMFCIHKQILQKIIIIIIIKYIIF